MCGLCLLIGFITSSTTSACSDNGTMCMRLIFIRPAGMRHYFVSKLISSHRGIAASAGRVIVKSCHSIRARVCPPIFMQLSLYTFDFVHNHPTTALVPLFRQGTLRGYMLLRSRPSLSERVLLRELQS